MIRSSFKSDTAEEVSDRRERVFQSRIVQIQDKTGRYGHCHGARKRRDRIHGVQDALAGCASKVVIAKLEKVRKRRE